MPRVKREEEDAQPPHPAQRAAVWCEAEGMGGQDITSERPVEPSVGGYGWPRYRPVSGPRAAPWGNESGTAEARAFVSYETGALFVGKGGTP